MAVPLLSAARPAAVEPRAGSALQREFRDAAERHGVPERVLLAVSFLQSRWDSHGGAPSVSGGYGPMHLTDAEAALADSRHHHAGAEDPRGDDARAARKGVTALPDTDRLPARLRTLERAARLTGLPASHLRTDRAAGISGGAALLARAQRDLGLPASGDPARWYAAVASYPAADSSRAARFFADEVFTVLRAGQRRTTDTGEAVVLPPTRKVAPDTRQLALLELPSLRSALVPECPAEVSCESVPAPREEYPGADGGTDYGNHDRSGRPASQRIEYLVVHDVEGYWEGALGMVRNPRSVSWHYTLRSSDGHVAQHVRTRDVAWHAGNWYVNSKSVGLEHEGFLTAPDAWYTEVMYRSSARLVRYLAERFDVPLDRQHVIGHDNVPGGTPSAVRGMHTDPGPYWDWRHYFDLLGAPFEAEPRDGAGRPGGAAAGRAPAEGEVVTVRPDHDAHRPVYTRCDGTPARCPARGSSAVRLHTAPDATSPLVRDAGLRPDGSPSTDGVNDIGARAATGQQYAVAGRSGEWTAIWYLGGKAWFRDPVDRPTAVRTTGTLVEAAPGRTSVRVYGRAYPERDAYPAGVPVQEVSPLPYTLAAGQRYVRGLTTHAEYLSARTFDPKGHTVVRGEEYHQIQFGHRVAFVKAADVRLLPAR
ncbi:N-acetylmuramoyl-L-alanine amidase [Streptomyces sp. 549]|uniref:N-acetylmuramoyl-L-alanine amidase n=1 Tax=Streptomyces sp. 549 TaxID=3049076 RepID=UPI0024C3B539|nr:N-acetylmuramoyl-L-alanine amidase [Streptomyces sp. 549]MDK1474763.1 N-acetylmuramoyl-L-alanine amidase [Streptomyces sp. 549]